MTTQPSKAVKKFLAYLKENCGIHAAERVARNRRAIALLDSFLEEVGDYDREVYPLLKKRLEASESVSPSYEELEAKCWWLEYEIEEMQMVIRSAMDVLKVVAGEKKEA